MNVLLLKDGTELEVKEGSTINGITTYIQNYSDLDFLSKSLSKENLVEVSCISDGIPKWKHKNMILKEPQYQVSSNSTEISVTFGLRKMTEQELKEDEVQIAISYLSDEQSLTVSNLYPEWSPKATYSVGDRRRYEGILYKCIVPHDGQDDWTPDVATALWTKVLIENTDVIPEWEQPDSTNGYSVGNQVMHNGVKYESLVDNNIWEPGVVGTENVWVIVE